MKPIEELLKNLARPEVLEFGLVTNRLPSVNVGGKFEPVDQEAPPTDVVIEMLSKMGGERHVEALGERPTQWTTRVDGIGVLAVAAIRRGDVVQARFTVVRRDSERQAAAPVSHTHAGPPPVRPGREASVPKVRVTSPLASTLQGTQGAAPPPSTDDVPRPLPARRAAGAPAPAPALKPKTEPSVAPPAPAPEPAAAAQDDAPWDEQEDDDEPTVQTASPPVSRSVAPPVSKPAEEEIEPRPKPARRPEVVKRPSIAPMVAAAPVAPPAEEDLEADTQALAREGLPKREEPPPATEASGAPRITSEVISEVPSTEPSVAADVRPLAEVTPEEVLGVAAALRAAVVHVVAGRPLLARVGVDLVSHGPEISADDAMKLARSILPPASWQRFEQEGACEAVVDVPRFGRVRATLSRQRTGAKITFRTAPRKAPGHDQLGLPAALVDAVLVPGLVVVSAPAGHGRTTTLAGIVSLLSAESSGSVVVLEEPIEYVHAKARGLIVHREVGTMARSFAYAVRTSFAQDADALVVGDVRDPDTAREVLNAIEALRLVVIAVRATSVARGFARLVDMLPRAEQARAVRTLAGSLTVAVNQRLVPSGDRARRHLASEVLPATPAVRAALREGRVDALTAGDPAPEGYVSLEESLASLVTRGLVSLESAKSLTEHGSVLEALAGGRAPKKG
ncbi:MAG: Flp pilus assembly complex ATPase component TadA [Myxococcales bacterium]|nr:Flp pilus assembly complex ATPase component TadA [Myxococcales bacterium]